MDGEWLHMPDQPNLQRREGHGQDRTLVQSEATGPGAAAAPRPAPDDTCTVPTFGEEGDVVHTSVHPCPSIRVRPPKWTGGPTTRPLPTERSGAGDRVRAV